jgi:hypothetical protein
MHTFDLKLSEAVFAEKVNMFGRRDDQVSADEPIPVGYFVNPRGFIRADGQIDPHPHPIDDAAILEQGMSREGIVWREVQIERAGYIEWLAEEYPSVAAALQPHEDDATPTLSGTTADEQRAIRRLADLLRQDQELKKPAARNALEDFNISGKGFLSRVWPKARVCAGLPEIARPGAPKKRPRAK